MKLELILNGMDGYPVYSANARPDSVELDECNEAVSSAADYRYYASPEYPYVNGCFRDDFDSELQSRAPSIRTDAEEGSSKEVLITKMERTC